MDTTKNQHSPNRQVLLTITLVESITLLLLLGIAVPLKHLLHYPKLVSTMGPIHGIAVLAYLWLTLNVAGYEQWRTSQVLRMLISALIPFGGYFTARKLMTSESK